MITLGQYIDFKNAGDNVFLQAQVVTGYTKEQLREKSMDDIAPSITKFIEECKDYNQNKLEKYIRIGDKVMGFHPNLEAMSFGEYLDLNQLVSSDFTNNLPKIMSILYRPVVSEFMHNYEIEKYDSNVHIKNADLFREVDMAYVNGAMVFPQVLRPADDEADGGEPDNDRAGNSLTGQYGWWHIIEELANRDLTKFMIITDLPAAQIFAHISYMKSYNNVMHPLTL
jgi:hypothetical protein